jgi:DNA-binding LacI/PurR family transcriptional regulator
VSDGIAGRSGKGPVRMRDVARHCGLSESTVSHVLNGTKVVSEQSREKVLRAVRELRYHPDPDARRLALGRSNFLGLIISDIENQFYAGLIKAFEAAALGSGFEVLLCTTGYEPDRTESAFRRMIENKVSGVAVMTSRIDPHTGDDLAEHDIPSVYLDSAGPGRYRSNLRLVYGTGVTAAVNYLYHLGHRTFAHLAGPQRRPSHAAYRRAVDAALSDLGLAPRVIEGDNGVSGGEEAVRTMLAGKELPTAVLCSNDLTAMSVTRTLAKCGVRVPADVSVVGADDIPFAALMHPPLTTVRIPREQLGETALRTLERMLAGEGGVELSLETQLVIRESTGPASLHASPHHGPRAGREREPTSVGGP